MNDLKPNKIIERIMKWLGLFKSTKISPEYEKIINQISEKFGCKFGKASQCGLYKIKKLGFNQNMVEFYANYEPKEIKVEKIILHSIDEIIYENTKLCPGWVSVKYGYPVFASNEYGDAFCFDINKSDENADPRIIFLSHEAIWDESTKEEVVGSVMNVADDLIDFLNKLYDGKIEETY